MDIGANSGVLSGILYTYSTSDHPSQFHRQRLTRFANRGWSTWRERPVLSNLLPSTAHAMTYINTADCLFRAEFSHLLSYSGTAVGIMKGFLGLRGVILIQVYQTLFNDKSTSFLLMLALLPSINPLLLMWFVRIYNTNEGDERKHLNSFSLIALIVAAYLPVIFILEHFSVF